MEEGTDEVRLSELECCPELRDQPVCDRLNFRYRLPFQPRAGEGKQRIPVEVVLHFLFERCSGPLVIGDPVYSTTLLPGEQVRLFTGDRHSRWSYDSESSLTYRHETTSEESLYSAGIAQALTDLTINESGRSGSSYEENWEAGSVGGVIGGFSTLLAGIGAGYTTGDYDAKSTEAFSRSLSRHAESASMCVAASVRAKSATSIGEVEHRTHAEGESEAHYESASRVFRNPNRCSAVTYLFRKLNKLQTISFRLVAIERRVEDPRAPTGAYQRVPVDTTGHLSVIPQFIPATSKSRLEIERMARTSASERQQAAASTSDLGTLGATMTAIDRSEPKFEAVLREAALEAVDKDLEDAGLLDVESGAPTEEFAAKLAWQREELLPTPGVIVKGCLDQCNTCEPLLQEEMKLDLVRKRLENEMLKRKIELLDKSRAYCSNADEIVGAEEPADD